MENRIGKRARRYWSRVGDHAGSHAASKTGAYERRDGLSYSRIAD